MLIIINISICQQSAANRMQRSKKGVTALLIIKGAARYEDQRTIGHVDAHLRSVVYFHTLHMGQGQTT